LHLHYTDGYDSSVVEYKWFHPKEKAVEFDPGGKELPHMVINNFVLEDCSYNDTSSEIILPLCDLRHFGQCLISGGFRGGPSRLRPPFWRRTDAVTHGLVS